MKNQDRHAGFAIVELLMVVGVLAAAGLTAWWVYNRQPNVIKNTAATTASSSKPSTANTHNSAATPAVSTATVATNVSTAPQIKSASDLNSALQTLNQNDPSAQSNGDTTQLSSSASGF